MRSRPHLQAIAPGSNSCESQFRTLPPTHFCVIRAGKANMFLSPLFTEAFVNATGVPVELYAADGSVGAAIGAGLGVGVFTEQDAFNQAKPQQVVTPSATGVYDDLYLKWKATLQKQLEKV